MIGMGSLVWAWARCFYPSSSAAASSRKRQFEVFTSSKWIALFLQAGLFGISHDYQGLEACVKIAIGGALFGLLALWRSSLRPGIVAHAGTDILGAIFG